MENVKNTNGISINRQWQITDGKCPKCGNKIAIDVKNQTAKCSFVKCGKIVPYNENAIPLSEIAKKGIASPANGKPVSRTIAMVKKPVVSEKPVLVEKPKKHDPLIARIEKEYDGPVLGLKTTKVEKSKIQKPAISEKDSLSLGKVKFEKIDHLRVVINAEDDDAEAMDLLRDWFIGGADSDVIISKGNWKKQTEWPTKEENPDLLEYLNYVKKEIKKEKFDEICFTYSEK